MEKYLEILLTRIAECVGLSISDEKAESVKTLLERHGSDLLLQVKDSKDVDLVKSKFSNFINKTLSTIEALGLEENQYKAVRKLVLGEINGCMEFVVKNLNEVESSVKDNSEEN